MYLSIYAPAEQVYTSWQTCVCGLRVLKAFTAVYIQMFNLYHLNIKLIISMKIFTISQNLSVKLFTALTLASLLMSVLPVGTFNAQAEDAPSVDATKPDDQPVVDTEVGTTTDETAKTNESPLMSASRVRPTKVKICHATESDGNPYVELDLSPAELLMHGHFTHDNDIIPPIELSPLPNFGGKNWDTEGQAIWNNDCAPVPPTVTTCQAFGSVVTTNLSTWNLSETRVNGHNELVSGGLHIYTDTDAAGSPDPRKAAGYYSTNFPLSGLGNQTIDAALDFNITAGTYEPGLQLVTDFDNNGTPDGILVGEKVYGNTWWLSNGSAPFVKTNAPNTGGGYGSSWYGTANEWLSKFPNAKVLAIGYSLGSGVNGNGVIKEINLGCVKYTFDLPPVMVKVHILKYLTDEETKSGISQVPDDSDAPSFPMTATWYASNIGGGTGNYVLGNTHGGSAFRYGADTSPMTAPADYTTSEITGGDSPVLPIKAECVPGKYRLVGYKEGDTTEEAEGAELMDKAPVYEGLDSDKTIIVVNELCGEVVVPQCKNLLQNASFESPEVTDHSGQWQIFPSVANWAITLSDGLEVWKNFNGTGAGLASNGIQNVELDGNDATNIAQDVVTIPGATYELTFDFSPRAGTNLASNQMDAIVDGTPVLSLSADGTANATNVWAPQSKTFVAATALTKIAFEDKGTADADGGYGPLLDNASLCLVKEPEPEPTCSLTIKSDGSDFVPEKNASAKILSTPLHVSWITAIPSSLAKWIWGDDPVVDGVPAETQTFTKSFNWTGGTVTGATLQIASDNSHDITLGTYNNGDATEVNYTAIKSYDVSAGVVPGMNTLSIGVKNFGMVGGTQATNPAGLMYDLTITGTGKSCGQVVPDLPKTTGEVTMCKVNEKGAPQSGWTLNLLGNKVEDIVVPTNTPTGINSSSVLNNGGSYVALASGTWNNQGGANPVDAEYSTTDAWTTHMDGYTGYSTDILELQINSAFDPNSNWGAYNASHKYAQGFTQTSTGTANFRIFDGTGTTVEPGWYPDNSGTLNVSLYKGYSGVTGENGCVTFKDVPFGAYTAGEIMQDGWETVSGTGAVTTAFPSPKTITIVNKLSSTDGDPVPTPTPKHLVSGVKWNDANGNGLKDQEPNLSGWTITATKGDVSTTTTTNDLGAYSFNLPAGTWTISEVAQNNWTQTGLYQNGTMRDLTAQEQSKNCTITVVTDSEASYSCDFGNKANAVVVIPDLTTNGGSSSGRHSSRSKTENKPIPQVLGASISSCSIYLSDYMRKGGAASSSQVTKLQIFLNAVGIKLPVSGLFDDATDQAVRAFQLQHKAEVLTPWFTAGIVPHDNPTGWVYQLTRWKINNIVCPGSEAYPVLN